MKLQATLPLAGRALMRSKMRSLLTTLGVVIGVAAVIAMRALGDGASARITREISDLGSHMLIVIPGGEVRGGFGGHDFGARLFTRADLDAIGRQCPAVRTVAGQATRPVAAVVGNTNWRTTLNAVTPEFFEIREWPPALGRPLNQEDEARGAKVCMLGETVRAKLFGSQDPVGSEVRIHAVSCQVVGVLTARGVSTFGMDQDDVVLIPFSTYARRISGDDHPSILLAAATSEERIDEARAEIRALLRERRHLLPGDDDDFTVRDMREITALLGSVTGILSSLLAGVAAVSLLVGGIGIMNVMLVSVTERTREVGVRLAVGARRIDILQQFLIEAIVLSSLGGLVGIGAGIAAAAGIARALHLPLVLSAWGAAVAFGVAALVGILFGVFPARKASRLRPIEALRFE